eukprot:11972634-Prorocentrum_lima.AAC.1
MALLFLRLRLCTQLPSLCPRAWRPPGDDSITGMLFSRASLPPGIGLCTRLPASCWLQGVDIQ